jgi:hypothetical protein
MIRGEPGVGTTALLSYAVEHASTMRVLTGVGTPSESGLPFAALHQLLRPVLGHLAAIPELQATALQGALGLAAAHGHDRVLIAVAVLTCSPRLRRSDRSSGWWTTRSGLIPTRSIPLRLRDPASGRRGDRPAGRRHRPERQGIRSDPIHCPHRHQP